MSCRSSNGELTFNPIYTHGKLALIVDIVIPFDLTSVVEILKICNPDWSICRVVYGGQTVQDTLMVSIEV